MANEINNQTENKPFDMDEWKTKVAKIGFNMREADKAMDEAKTKVAMCFEGLEELKE